MSAVNNKSIVRHMYESIVNKKQLQRILDFYAPSYENHNPGEGEPEGVKGVEQAFKEAFKSFSDFEITVKNLISENDKVVAHIEVNGTHDGDFLGMPASGQRIKVSGTDIFRLDGGRIVERWGVFDQLGMMQQLGFLPIPD